MVMLLLFVFKMVDSMAALKRGPKEEKKNLKRAGQAAADEIASK
jgi:hypothetical protein